jgi:hypothetical protein
MATSPKNATNKQHAAFPTLFNRMGEARRIKGFRATREMFSRAIRMAKVLEMSPRLMVMTPIGALMLSEAATTLIKEDGGVESLLLNGFDILPARDVIMHEMVDSFLRENKLIGQPETVDMFDDEATDA